MLLVNIGPDLELGANLASLASTHSTEQYLKLLPGWASAGATSAARHPLPNTQYPTAVPALSLLFAPLSIDCAQSRAEISRR